MRDFIILFLQFFKIGAITFGSGYVMVTIVEREFVDKRKWLTKDEFMNYLSLATSFPGPIVINLASLLGHRKMGFKGVFAGFLGASMPSFLILLFIAMTFSTIAHEPVVIAIFKGIRPAVIGVLLVPVINFSKSINRWEYPIFISCGFLIFYGILSPIALILMGVVSGVLLVIYNNRKLNKVNQGSSKNSPN